MHHHLLKTPRAFLLRSCVVLLFATSVLPARAAKSAWLKLETDEFVIYSDAKEKDLVASALNYAAFRRVLDDFFVPAGGSLPTSRLLLFRNQKDFHAHSGETKRDWTVVNYNAEVDGTPLSSFALTGRPDEGFRQTFEFETIWALKRLGYHVPIWMSQGTGGVVAAIKIRPNSITVGDIERPAVDALAWPRFFEVGRTSNVYQNPEKLGGFLEQARGLMHWILLQDESTQQRFHDLALRLRTVSGIEAVEQITGHPAKDFEKRIHEHLYRTPRRELLYSAPTVIAGFRIGPAPEAETLTIKADLLVANGRAYEADVNLDRALELGPELAVVKEAFARRRLREGLVSDAITLYREAIAAGSKNGAAYVRSADARLNEARTRGRDVAGEGGPAAAIAINELRQAIRLNPGDADAYRLLGRAFFVSPDLTPTHIAELSQGVFLGEEGQLVRIYRAALYNRLDQLEEAQNDLRLVIADPDVSPRNRQIAQERLASYRFERDVKGVQAHVKAHDYAAAREILGAALAHAESEPLQSNYENLGKWIDELEAWARIEKLYTEKQWEDLFHAAESFVETFPRSRMVPAARRLMSEAKASATAEQTMALRKRKT